MSFVSAFARASWSHPLRTLASTTLVASSIVRLAAADPMPTAPTHHHRTATLENSWRFSRGDTTGAEAPAFNDSAWTQVNVPHDWSIAGPRAPDATTGMPGGYAPAGIGWYRRSLDIPATWKGQTIWIEFEGVYMNAQVWVNGQSLGVQRYGYSTFQFDLTSHVKPGGTNVLAVRVDNSAQPNSRWYSGSGIYRPVHLHAADPVRIKPQGVWITTTSLSPTSASVRVRTTVVNDSSRRRQVTLESRVLAPGPAPLPLVDPEPLALQNSTVTLAPRESTTVMQDFTIANPAAWSPDSPALYRLVSRVTAGNRFADAAETKFGVRTVRVTPERGFELNGQPLELNGANVHHDHGPLGAASYRSVEYRRARLLKVGSPGTELEFAL